VERRVVAVVVVVAVVPLLDFYHQVTTLHILIDVDMDGLDLVVVVVVVERGGYEQHVRLSSRLSL